MPREKKLMRSKISNYPVARLGYGVALYRKNSAKALAEPDFGWDGVIRTHAYRSQSLYKCFICFVIYYYIIPLKKALSQAFSQY